MRRIIFLVPILFLGIKPYQQPTGNQVKADSLTQFEKDTVVLSMVKNNIEVQIHISQELDQRKKQLLSELKKIIQRERELKRKRKEKRELEKMINDLEKFNNRGL